MRVFVFFICITISFASFGANYTVPYNYILKEGSQSDGVMLYRDKYLDDTLGEVYAIVVDVSKVNIDLGVTDYEKHENGHNKYDKKSLSRWWRSTATSKTFAMVNGQFFNQDTNPSPLSYPLKSNKNIKTNHEEDDKLRKRTLFKYPANKQFYIWDGYESSLLKDIYSSDLIVGLHPDESSKKYNYTIGRHLIGGIAHGNCNPDERLCAMRYLVFLLGKSNTQNNMVYRLKQWGVKKGAMVLMDGSGSSQFKTKKHELYGNSIPLFWSDKRELPNVIRIDKK